MSNNIKWLSKSYESMGYDELVKELQYYEVTMASSRKRNHEIISEIKRLMIKASRD